MRIQSLNSKNMEKERVKDLVSVIIPTTDKELKMASYSDFVLEFKQSYEKVEVVIVNEGLERSKQRNIGIERSNGEFILYLDSDQYVSPRLISECVFHMKQGYDAVYIPEEITDKSLFGRIRNFERQFYTATPVDCVRFIRASKCPLFNEDLNGPEDADHDRRVVGKRTTSANPLFHDDKVSVWDYFRKKSYYSKSMTKYKELYPNDKVLDWKYRCFLIFFEDGKWKMALSNPLYMMFIFMIIFVRGIIYIKNK